MNKDLCIPQTLLYSSPNLIVIVAQNYVYFGEAVLLSAPSLTDRVTTPTRDGRRRCRWPRLRHAVRLTALARSRRHRGNLLLRTAVITHSTPQ